MNKMRYAVKLNMKDVGTFNTGIRLKQGDSAITFVFRIYSGDNYLFNESDVPHIVFKRPDGSSVVGEMSVIEGQYTYNFKGNELEIGGNVIADVKFNMYGDRGSTSSFMFECVPDTLSTISQGGGVYVNDMQYIYEDILNKYSRLDQLIHEFDYESIQQDIGEITTTLTEVRNLKAELQSLVPVNNLLATVPGSPLDAVQGKALSDAINSVNADLTNVNKNLTSRILVREEKNINSNPYTFVLPTNRPASQYATDSYIALIYYKDIYSVNGIGVYLIRGSSGSWVFYEITNQHDSYMNITETGTTSDLYPYVKFSGLINLYQCKATLFRLD